MVTVVHVNSDKTREIKQTSDETNNKASQVNNVLRSSCSNRDDIRKLIQFKR